jgi:hypothetical protein
MKRGAFTGFIILIFVVLFLISYEGSGVPKEFPAPDFMMTDVFTGRDIKLSAFLGRPVLMYFFASW